MQRPPDGARLVYTSKRVTATWREEPGTTGPYPHGTSRFIQTPPHGVSHILSSSTTRDLPERSPWLAQALPPARPAPGPPEQQPNPARRCGILPTPQEVQRTRPSPRTTSRVGPPVPFVCAPHEEPPRSTAPGPMPAVDRGVVPGTSAHSSGVTCGELALRTGRALHCMHLYVTPRLIFPMGGARTPGRRAPPCHCHLLVITPAAPGAFPAQHPPSTTGADPGQTRPGASPTAASHGRRCAASAAR